MKKFAKVLTSMAVCSLMALTAVNAAGGIDANEKAVLDNLKSGINVNGKTVALDSAYITQAENYFAQDGVDMTDGQKDIVVAQIEAAKKVIVDNNITDLKTISKKYQDQIIEIAQVAAKTMGLTLSADYSSKTIKVLDKDGKVIFTAEKAIKNTGDNFTSTLALSGAIAILLAGAGMVAAKKGLLSK